MIPFFRKIRYQLAQDNQFFKYSRYAIGEIVLVVIGILIALQINTWNEERKLKNVTKKYVDRLIIDIEKDTLIIHNALESRQRSINNINTYFEFFESSNSPLDTMVHSATSVEFELGRYIPVNYTFADMQATGNLDLLSQKQQHALMKLDHFQKVTQFVAEKLMDEYWAENLEMNKYLGARPSRYSVDYYAKFGLQRDPKLKLQGLIHMNNMLLLLKNYHENQTKMGLDIVQASRETLEVLKQDN